MSRHPGLLAHSGRANRGIPAQPYREHVLEVVRLATQRAREMLAYHGASDILGTVRLAAEYHDLGKLDAANQTVLGESERGRLPVNHVDAGAAQLRTLNCPEGAIAVYSHHIGLCDLPSEIGKDRQAPHNASMAALRDPSLKIKTDEELKTLVELHERCVGPGIGDRAQARRFTGLERRLLLSCLVDADHSDTARHYGEGAEAQAAAPRWAERLAALDAYVLKLASKTGARNEFRGRVYQECRQAPGREIYACDSPVGSGKTTAVMAYLLRIAEECGLRRIFVVLPFTNIIRQAAATYRGALVLPGEDPATVVAEHHHAVEFASPDARHLTTLWEAPIVVTTAVQFFETLAASQTARLRKLHQLPGSAVFIDEAHAAMPIHLWPFQMGFLRNLTREWSCRVVLGSGSLTRFWEQPRIMGEQSIADLPSMLPKELSTAGAGFERQRVRYETRPDPLDMPGLCSWIMDHPGPRLVVMNTVQSAAAVARRLRNNGVATEHLSTALSPQDRDVILTRVKSRLQGDEDWVLVATSCVEAGVDLSFATAFRERSRASSLIQIGGRVNRHGERGTGVVWDFVANDPLLTAHPAFTQTRRVVELLFLEGRWDQDPGDLVTYALEQEFKLDSAEKRIAELRKHEGAGAYPTVSMLARLIQADTRLVVVDSELAKSLRSGGRVNTRTLIQRSVQLWASKIGNLDLPPLGYGGEIFEWRYPYDGSFLGIMEGMLQMEDSNLAHCSFV